MFAKIKKKNLPIQNDTKSIIGTSGTIKLESRSSHVNHPIITDEEIIVLESLEILKKRVQTESTLVQQLFQFYYIFGSKPFS